MARWAARFVLKGALMSQKKKRLTGRRLQTKNGEKRRRKDEKGEERERRTFIVATIFSAIKSKNMTRLSFFYLSIKS
jgi:hypothetical protein